MTLYMLRFPEASQKDHDKPDVSSRYIDGSIERVMFWGAKLAQSTKKSIEVVSFHDTKEGNRMKEYGEFQVRKDFGLIWTSYAGSTKWNIYKVIDVSSYPMKMTKIGRL